MPAAEKQKLMKAMMPVTGGLKDQYLDIAAHRPDVLINDYLVPAIRKKYGMTLTDEEKLEMASGDERARQILERTESMPREQFMKMHGVLRQPPGARS